MPDFDLTPPPWPPTEPPEFAATVFELLKLPSIGETGKFAVAVLYEAPYDQQKALEWCQLNDWIRLIDITPLKHGNGGVYRIFRVMPAALAYKAHLERH